MGHDLVVAAKDSCQNSSFPYKTRYLGNKYNFVYFADTGQFKAADTGYCVTPIKVNPFMIPRIPSLLTFFHTLRVQSSKPGRLEKLRFISFEIKYLCNDEYQGYFPD